MKHGLQQLVERLRYNRERNISFASDELLAEVEEDLELYGPNTNVTVWVDPKDDFVKDYYVIDLELEDDEECVAAEQDKRGFVENKQPNDIYLITLGELLDILKQQDEVLWHG
nr:MAG TPA: hypothetical protein [Caudoviricetes sp.]